MEHRGKIEAKNKGELDMYFLHRLKKKYSADRFGIVPNEEFWKVYEMIQKGGKIQPIKAKRGSLVNVRGERVYTKSVSRATLNQIA